MTDKQQDGEPEPTRVHFDLSGTAHNAAQADTIHGGVHFNTYVNGTSTEDATTPPEESPDQLPPRSAKSPLWLLLIPIAVVVIILHSCGPDTTSQANGDQFPSSHGTRPAGSTNQAVLEAVSSKIHSCTQAVVSQPVNCPQSVETIDTQESDVQWSGYGDPTDGAQVVWHDTAFYIRGVAIMTVAYDRDTIPAGSPPVAPVQVVPYQAVVTWKDNKALVQNIQKTGLVGSGIIKKHHPGINQDQAADALRKAFDQCRSATTEPMPPACPQPSLPGDDTSVTWTFQGDPVLNISQPSFDASTGLIHVTGSYAATGNTTDFGFSTNYHQGGNYTATLFLDAGTLRCLEIQSAS
jgi:hypothetical protein